MTVDSAFIVDADDSNFEALVIEASHDRPVVVDFWAEWCGPCRQLGPLLEGLAREFAGAFTLVKVDTERAQRTAQAWNVRSIPQVVGIRRGEVVCEFVGAQPEGAVRAFLDRLLPSHADERHLAGLEHAAAGRTDEAEATFREVLALEDGHPEASIALGHLLLARDDIAGAREIVEAAQRGTSFDSEIERLRAAIEIREGGGADIATLEAQVASRPADPAARLTLGRALAAAGRYPEAIEQHLESVRLDPEFDEQAARRALLDLFEVLGSDHDLTREARASLARTLYR